MKFSVLFALALSGITLAQDGKEPRFSIGLGVLAPSYSQKLAGNGRLDVDQNKNGFSYTLNNVPHPSSGSSASYQSQSNPQSYGSGPAHTSGSDYSSPQGQFSIYQHRSIPKQSETYHSPSEDEYNGPQQSSAQSLGSPHQTYQQYNSPATSGQSLSSGQYNEPQDYNSEPLYDGQNGANGQQHNNNGPRFVSYNFEQEIAHQLQNQQPFGAQPHYQSQGGQSYQSQPSHPQSYQSQPTQQRVIRLQTPLQSQPQHQSRHQFQHQPQHQSQDYVPLGQYSPHKQQSSVYNPHRV